MEGGKVRECGGGWVGGKDNKSWEMADGWADGRTDGIIHCCLAALCGWCFDSVRFDGGELCVWWAGLGLVMERFR